MKRAQIITLALLFAFNASIALAQVKQATDATANQGTSTSAKSTLKLEVDVGGGIVASTKSYCDGTVITDSSNCRFTDPNKCRACCTALGVADLENCVVACQL